MPNNAYMVYIPDENDPNKIEMRTGHYYGEPPDYGAVIDIVIAEKPSQAKYEFLKEWAGTRSTGVYHDDWPLLRVRLLQKNVPEKKGCMDFSSSRYWDRVHEILDHESNKCDCPDEDEYDSS